MGIQKKQILKTKKAIARKRSQGTQTFQAPKGMHDIYEPDIALFDDLQDVVRDLARAYGYQHIEIPVLEDKDLFVRSVGLDTDMVEKEMYVLKTRGRDILALRPEGTAGVARAYIQNGFMYMPQPVKLWYWGPMFRYENPQAGRYRQHIQAGFEFLGADNPIADAETMQLAVRIGESFGLKNVCVYLNSIGCSACRVSYRKALKAYYRTKSRKLCSDCKRRLHTNALRLLDCKNETCMMFRKDAPETLGYLCKDCSAHFKKVLEFLDEMKINYFLDPYLVRGLDYYNRTVFELKAIPSQQQPIDGHEQQKEPLSFGGGGRYDYLMKMLGGPDTTAVGFALGIDRMVEIAKQEQVKAKKQNPRVYVIQMGDIARTKALQVLDMLRAQGIFAGFDLCRDSIKAQFRSADRLGVRYALIIGQKEVVDHEVLIRDMETGIQESIPEEKMIEALKERLRLARKDKINHTFYGVPS